MIGTIVHAEVRQSRVDGHDYLAVQFVDDYEQPRWFFVSPLAIHLMKQFCDMVKWDWEGNFVGELVGRIISVDSKPERFGNRMFTKWFIRSDWREN